MDFGPAQFWKDGDTLIAENDFVRLAYAVSDDPRQIGTCGWFGPRQVWVEFINAETAKRWDGADHSKGSKT